MRSFEKINELTQNLKEAQEELEHIRKEFQDDPDLLEIYEPSAKYLVQKTRKKLLNMINETSENTETDLWVRLQGESVKNGTGPSSVISKFLDKLNTANKHAVSILEEVKHHGGRFVSEIKDLADFNLVAMEKGSLKLGISRPDYNKFIQDKIKGENYNQISMFDKAENIVYDAMQETKTSLDGISLLLETLSIQNEDDLEKLMGKVGSKKEVLRLVYYARKLTPSSISEVESISFYGKKKYFPKKEIKIDLNTRTKLKEVSEHIMANKEKYVKGTGIIRGVDIDKKYYTIRPLLIEDKPIDEVKGEIKVDLSSSEIADYINKQVELAGFLNYSEKGEITNFEIEEISREE